jgi:hypothetical protein
MPQHKLTDEERQRGRANRWSAHEEKRREAEEQAVARLAEELCRATDVLAEAMEAESFALTEAGPVPIGPAHSTRVRAAAQVLDRVLGRATQRTEHSGRIDHTIVTAEAREYLARKLTDRATRAAEADHPRGSK